MYNKLSRYYPEITRIYGLFAANCQAIIQKNDLCVKTQRHVNYRLFELSWTRI